MLARHDLARFLCDNDRPFSRGQDLLPNGPSGGPPVVKSVNFSSRPSRTAGLFRSFTHLIESVCPQVVKKLSCLDACSSRFEQSSTRWFPRNSAAVRELRARPSLLNFGGFFMPPRRQFLTQVRSHRGECVGCSCSGLGRARSEPAVSHASARTHCCRFLSIPGVCGRSREAFSSAQD